MTKEKNISQSKKKIVLFGAGVYAKTYKSLLDFLGVPFDFFTDNDSQKFGKVLYGKQIIPPQDLIEMDCNIIISCCHGEPIKKQLEELGIADKLLEFENLSSMFRKKISTMSIRERNLEKREKTVLLDMYEGIGWGGTEIWAATVAKGLYELGYKAELVGAKEQDSLSEDYEKLVTRFDSTNTIEQMVSYMLDRLPFVLINNFSGCAYLAAVMLKEQFPDKVHIIGVVHGDNQSLFATHMVFKEWVDGFICVSSTIREKIIANYCLDADKVFYKEQPIEMDFSIARSYQVNQQPLRIGYAGRLVKQCKRVDLLPKLIGYLEKLKVDYQLEIAGDGESTNEIANYIEQHKLSHKVILCGRIEKKKMQDFWMNKDIYLNISDSEGACLSMLEAMGCGCVPVVTDISGVRDYLKDSYNSFICDVDDLYGIAKAIQKIEGKRIILQEYGNRCRKEVIKRCNKDKYFEFIVGLIDNEYKR